MLCNVSNYVGVEMIITKYWNNVTGTEKLGLFSPSDMGDYPILASPIYMRLTVTFIKISEKNRSVLRELLHFFCFHIPPLA
jgi:hypothetical protein